MDAFQMKLNKNTCCSAAPNMLQPLQDVHFPGAGWNWTAILPAALTMGTVQLARLHPPVLEKSHPLGLQWKQLSTAQWCQPTALRRRHLVRAQGDHCTGQGLHVCPREGQQAGEELSDWGTACTQG